MYIYQPFDILKILKNKDVRETVRKTLKEMKIPIPRERRDLYYKVNIKEEGTYYWIDPDTLELKKIPEDRRLPDQSIMLVYSAKPKKQKTFYRIDYLVAYHMSPEYIKADIAKLLLHYMKKYHQMPPYSKIIKIGKKGSRDISYTPGKNTHFTAAIMQWMLTQPIDKFFKSLSPHTK